MLCWTRPRHPSRTSPPNTCNLTRSQHFWTETVTHWTACLVPLLCTSREDGVAVKLHVLVIRLHPIESRPDFQLSWLRLFVVSHFLKANTATVNATFKCAPTTYFKVFRNNIYEGCFKSSWTGGSEPLLCRGRRWLLCQVVVVGVT
jgi:hypothetical protein